MNLERYFNYKNGSITYGLTNELIAFFVDGLYKNTNDNIILVTSNLYESNKLFNVLTNHFENVCLFPMDDFITAKVVAISPEFELGRLNTLEKIKNGFLEHNKELTRLDLPKLKQAENNFLTNLLYYML